MLLILKKTLKCVCVCGKHRTVRGRESLNWDMSLHVLLHTDSSATCTFYIIPMEWNHTLLNRFFLCMNGLTALNKCIHKKYNKIIWRPVAASSHTRISKTKEQPMKGWQSYSAVLPTVFFSIPRNWSNHWRAKMSLCWSSCVCVHAHSEMHNCEAATYQSQKVI